MSIQNKGKGAIQRPLDARAFKIEVLGAKAPVDWQTGFRLPNPGDEDQGTSSSCVAQASSYYHNQIHPANYSRRDLYARIFQPGGGAYLQDGPGQIIKRGQATRDKVKDPVPQTEPSMEDKTGITITAEAPFKERAYYSLPDDIESIAESVRDYQGAVIGIRGSNQGWADMVNPRPPSSGEPIWGHALYALGYHMDNGLRCIICKSSWCDEVSEHHIKENYFQSGYTFNNLTMVPKGAMRMLVFFQVKTDANKTLWTLMDGMWVGFSDTTALANYITGRPNTVLLVDQAEFDKVQKSVDVFKS